MRRNEQAHWIDGFLDGWIFGRARNESAFAWLRRDMGDEKGFEQQRC
jgi:hypothetical protein